MPMFVVLALVLAATGCGAPGPAASDADAHDAASSVDATDASVAPGDGGVPRTSGVVVLDACTTLGTGSEACGYSFVWSPAACSSGRCRRLMIYFSGGQESCPAVSPAAGFLAHFADAGYVAVCARDFDTPTGSATYPRHLEATRLDALVHAITTDPDVSAAWTGEDLLLSGVSHGASGPMIAIAHAGAERAAAWRGSRYTGACFFDGTYDAPGLLQFDHDQACDSHAIVSYQRAWSRYCAWPAGADPDVPASWPVPATCSTADTAADTLTLADVTALPIHDFQLIECGSMLTERCGDVRTPLRAADVLPASSITQLCTHIAASPGYTCTLGSHPLTGHVQCGSDAESLDDCNAWFGAQLASHGF
jgi:hypothetical protein